MGTSTNLEWFQKSLYNISHDQDIISNLSELKIALCALNGNQLKYIASSLNLNGIFDCLNSSAKNQIELSCEVLKVLFNALEPKVILQQYGAALLRALKHPNVDVKELVLLELNRAACESDLAPRLSEEPELLLCVVDCVGHEESAVARRSIQFFTRLGTTTQGLQAVYSPKILEALRSVMKTNDTNRFRVYEIAVEISANSDPGLEASHLSGILEVLLQELQKDDPLVLLTTLEFVTKLALTHHGHIYLETRGIVRYLANYLASIDENPCSSLLLSGLIKFFGNVAHLRPQEMFQSYPQVMSVVLKTVNESDPNLVCVALETISYVATTVPGKQTLNKQGNLMSEVMTKIWEIVVKWPSESRVRGLNMLANILHLELSDQDTEMLSLTESLFTLIGQPSAVMARLVEFAQQPFPEIKLAVLLLIQSLAEQPWGQKLIHNTPGLEEMLFNRSSDTTMQEKSARFAVVRALSDSPTSEAIFGEETIKRFKKFISEGAVYVQIQTEVAIEKA